MKSCDSYDMKIKVDMLLLSLLKPIPRWIADEILQKDCSRLVGFQLPIMSGKEVAKFPGISSCLFFPF